MPLTTVEQIQKNQNGRTFVMSDLHGISIETLNSFIASENITAQDTLIICGDVIDRGSDSIKLINYIKDTQNTNKPQIKMILGNHEATFLCNYARRKLAPKDPKIEELKIFFGKSYFENSGFTETDSESYYSMQTEYNEDNDTKIFDFLYNLPLCLHMTDNNNSTDSEISTKSPDRYFVHASLPSSFYHYDQEHIIKNSSPKDLQKHRMSSLWNRQSPIPYDYNDNETIVYYGHTSLHPFTKKVKNWHCHNLDINTDTTEALFAVNIDTNDIYLTTPKYNEYNEYDEYDEYDKEDSRKQCLYYMLMYKFYPQLCSALKVTSKIILDLQKLAEENVFDEALKNIFVDAKQCVDSIKLERKKHLHDLTNTLEPLINQNNVNTINTSTVKTSTVKQWTDCDNNASETIKSTVTALRKIEETARQYVDFRRVCFSICGTFLGIAGVFIPFAFSSYRNFFFSSTVEIRTRESLQELNTLKI